MKTISAIAMLVFVMVATSSPAGAALKDIGTWETEIGSTCMLVDGNNESIWPGNVLIITNGDETYEVAGVEDEPNVQIEFTFVALAEKVSASVRYEEWSSLDVVVNCVPQMQTTTTTEQVTTTTTEGTTTTSSPEETTTTTEPSTTTSSTTSPDNTTTTTLVDCVDGIRNSEGCITTTSTTTPTTTTTRPDGQCEGGGQVGVDCHPDTGSDTALVVSFGLLLSVLGAITLAVRQLFVR